MAAHGASLQNFNNQLVGCFEEMKERRDVLTSEIGSEEEQKNQLQAEISLLTNRLHIVNESISQKNATRADYDKTLSETESAYMKILESSQTLLHVLKREGMNLTKKG